MYVMCSSSLSNFELFCANFYIECSIFLTRTIYVYLRISDAWAFTDENNVVLDITQLATKHSTVSLEEETQNLTLKKL